MRSDSSPKSSVGSDSPAGGRMPASAPTAAAVPPRANRTTKASATHALQRRGAAKIAAPVRVSRISVAISMIYAVWSGV